ncbi:MAG: exodeoxyribonuclease III [Actinobacteria bacterium]|nr:exodeoxyribonuclease III [Actinomycetota bacterium]
MIRIATWNVNSLRARVKRVVEWIQYASPDVLCLQETKMGDDMFLTLFAETFDSLGYESVHFGNGPLNGVAILSRVGLRRVNQFFSDGSFSPTSEASKVECRLVEAVTNSGVKVFSVYVPNGRSLDSEHYRAKLDWLANLRRYLDGTCKPDSPVVLCGDFNVAPFDIDVWDPAHFIGATHVSPPERDALAYLCDFGLVDVFRRLYHEEGLYSWWDYRGGAFHQHKGMRIDLMLATRPLADKASFGLIDRFARRGGKDNQPSDHAPVFIDFSEDVGL